MYPGAPRWRDGHRNLAAVLALGAAFAVQAVVIGAPVSESPSNGKPVVLQKFPAGNDEFDLVIAACRSKECPVQVWLRQQGKTVDRFTLPVSAPTQRAKPEAVDEVWGADIGLKSWATGVETSYVSTLGRTVTLVPGETGLLVTQNSGFEHRKRGHVFLLPSEGKLVAAWSYQEGSGPTWSATNVVPGNAKDVQEIILFRGFRDPTEESAEHLDAVRVDAGTSVTSLRETPLPDRARPLYLLHVGSYSSPVEARKARLAEGYCLGAYWVLDSVRFGGLVGGKVILGNIYARREVADAEARSTKECLPSVTASVTQWTQAR